MSAPIEVTVIFESGDFATARIDRETFETTEYWTEISERQNQWGENSFEPVVAYELAGKRIPLDDSGDWLLAFEQHALTVWPDARPYA